MWDEEPTNLEAECENEYEKYLMLTGEDAMDYDEFLEEKIKALESYWESCADDQNLEELA